MADIQIESTTATALNDITGRIGIHWRNQSIGYIFYLNSSLQLVYRKTTDGGGTWGSATTIDTDEMYFLDTYGDCQTITSGNLVHMALVNKTDNVIQYRYFNIISEATAAYTIEASQGGTVLNESLAYKQLSITKANSGRLCVAGKYRAGASIQYDMFAVSDDNGATWTDKTSPWTSPQTTLVHAFPNPTASDTDDVCLLYTTSTTNKVYFNKYDATGNSWSLAEITDLASFDWDYIPISGCVRKSDGHIIVAFVNAFADTGDVEVWDCDVEAESFTQKTNYVNGSEDGSKVISPTIEINQATDRILIAHIHGGTGATTQCYYGYSDNGGTSWTAPSGLSTNGLDDIRSMSVGSYCSMGGGVYMPVWYNDDLLDLLTYDLGIDYAAYVFVRSSSPNANKLISAGMI